MADRKKIEKIFWYSALAAVIVAGFILRFKYVMAREFTYDEALYAWSAERLAGDITLISSAEISNLQPPFFPLLLMLGKSLLGLPSSLATYILIVVITSLIGVWGIFVLGSRISSNFLGLFCAFCLALNAGSIVTSVYVVNDIPLMVLSIFLLLLLKEVATSNQKKTDIGVGVVLFLMIGMKNAAIVVLPFVAVFYLLLPKPPGVKAKVIKLAIPAGIALFTLSVFCLINYFNDVPALPIVSVVKFSGFDFKRIWDLFIFYVFAYHPKLLVLAFFAGCFYILRQKDYFERFLIAYSWTVFVILFNLIDYDYRYGTLIVPPMLLISGLGVERLLNHTFKEKNVLHIAQIVVFVLFGTWYVKTIPNIDHHMKMRVALVPRYGQAAKWVQEHSTAKTVIVSQEARLMRYYTRINFESFGGRIVDLPLKREDIVRVLKERNGHVILDVNKMRDRAKADFHPFTKAEEEEGFLKAQGFVLRDTTYQKACEAPDCGLIPVVKVFERKAP